MTETLCPALLRREPQLAPLDMLTHATEIAIVALCASHPRVEHELDDCASPGESCVSVITYRPRGSVGLLTAGASPAGGRSDAGRAARCRAGTRSCRAS